MEVDRRSWLAAAGLGAVSTLSAHGAKADEIGCPGGDQPLRLQDFRPRSMLHVKETRVATPRFPVIDVHTHLTFAKGSRRGAASEDAVAFTTSAKAALAVMDRKGVKAAVNLTGGFGGGLGQAIAALDRAHPGRFHTCTEPMWGEFSHPRCPQLQADASESAARALHMKSENEGSNISKELKVSVKQYPYLTWRWKALVLPKGGDSRKAATDDQACQIYVTFPRFPTAVRRASSATCGTPPPRRGWSMPSRLRARSTKCSAWARATSAASAGK